MVERNGNDPARIRADAESQMNNVDNKLNEIIDSIEKSRESRDIVESQISNAEELHTRAMENIKKIANDAMETTGDADQDQLFGLMFFVTSNRLGLSVIYLLFSLYSNRNIRYLLQTYYNICKNTIHMYAGLLLVVCFLATLIYTFNITAISCDAPRA
jgi:hypothetical protein